MSELTLEQIDRLEVVAEELRKIGQALSEAGEKLTNLIDFPECASSAPVGASAERF